MPMILDSHAEQKLNNLAADFETWRQNRATKWERIPPPLWDRAVFLTKVISLAQVSKRLRLGYMDLKKRCAAHRAQTDSVAIPLPGFVEVTEPLSRAGAMSGYEIELQRPDGIRMRIRSPEAPAPLAELVRLFLGGA